MAMNAMRTVSSELDQCGPIGYCDGGYDCTGKAMNFA